jgi:general stress protein 26
MSSAEINQFLAGRRTAVLSSLSPNGTIHSVAMWYGFLEGAIPFETKSQAQKVQNIHRNANTTCLVEDGERYEELRGVVLVGRAETVEDPERIWPLGVSVFARYYALHTEDRRA